MTTSDSIRVAHSTTPVTLISELISWLANLEQWAVAMTLTFDQPNHSNRSLTDRAIIDVTCAFIQRVNQEIFGHGARRKNLRVGSAFCIERNSLGDHPHVHLTLTIPPSWQFSEFEILLQKLTKRFTVIGRQVDIQPYVNSGWIGYCVKHGAEGLVIDQIQEAYPR